MRTILQSLFLVVSFVLLTSQTPARKTAPPSLVGKWSKAAGSVWELRTDNTYTMSMGDGQATVSGRYTVEENRLTIVDQSATGLAEACGTDEKGVYTFTVNANTLTLTKANDPCRGRDSFVSGTYSRQ
jgi:hypothetical protein